MLAQGARNTRQLIGNTSGVTIPDLVTEDALQHNHFSRNGVRRGTRRRTEPNWADLAVELKSPAVTLLILWEEYRGIECRIPTATATGVMFAARFVLRELLYLAVGLSTAAFFKQHNPTSGGEPFVQWRFALDQTTYSGLSAGRAIVMTAIAEERNR